MRLAVLSARELVATVNQSTFGLLEDELAGANGSSLVHPPPLRRPTLRPAMPAWLDAIRTVRRADAVFWLHINARPRIPLWALGYARPTAQRCAYILDAWRGTLDRAHKLMSTQRIDPCFIAFREAQQELRARTGSTRYEWAPFGFDQRFFRGHGEPKTAFAYWMGRRYDPLHRALLDYCEERGLVYDYTKRGGEVADPMALGRRVAAARFFLVTPPDLDNPQRTGGFSPLVMRYYEGLGAGCALLGVKPRSGEYDDLLSAGAMIEVTPDGSDLAQRLDGRDDDALSANVARAQADVHAHHTWSARAQTMRAAIEARLVRR